MAAENTTSSELTEEMRGLRGDLRVILTKLFGADDSTENPQGRIPRLEAQVSDHESRIGLLESLKQRASGAGWLVATIMAVIDLLYHLLTLRGH